MAGPEAPDSFEGVPHVQFDYRSDPELWSDPWGRWAELAHAHRFFVSDTGDDPIWVVTRFEDAWEVFHDYRTFSNRSVAPWDPIGAHRFVPLELDPPELLGYRRLFAPWFSLGAIDRLEPDIRRWCAELVAGLRLDGRCEFVSQFASQFPTKIFLGQMGLPFEDLDMLMEWENAFLHTNHADDPGGQIRASAIAEIRNYLAAAIDARRRRPSDDLLSELANAEVNGGPIPEGDLHEAAFLLYTAGLDTVADQLGSMFCHLATHPDQLDRLVAGPDALPAAIEEFLRFYAVATPGRLVERDVDFHGCPMKAGDRVLVSLAAVHRDAGAFTDADDFVIDRRENPHMAFVVGPHRCLGSNLARTELRIAFQEWHARIPRYELDPLDPPEAHGGPNIGFRRFGLVWDSA
jgi:cytochrome P450